MKPIYVILIALVSAVVGAILGSLLGGATGGIGGSTLGARAGICTTTEVAKSQNLLTPEQANQLVNQSYAQLAEWGGEAGKDLIGSDNPDCQTVLNEVKEIGKVTNNN